MENRINYFKNKKILIIVPHEDDELNLIGGLLNSNYIDKDNTYIAYMTNGDYNCSTKTRLNEAKKTLKLCGIKDENIIFLGYCDQHFSENNHIYMTLNDEVFESKKKKNETYLTIKENEYSWQKRKKHSKFNQESLINDLEFLIEDNKPDIIFTNDFDSHPDHRCLTLCFDKAIGRIIKKESNYHPTVFKGFCYPTEYTGYEDYDNINLLSTKFKKEIYNQFDYQNPYYEWDKRIRFFVGKEVFNYFLLKNKLYMCLKKHKSQLLLRKYKSIINSDQIFWQKETNNLSIRAKIYASSGEAKYLNDCMTFDCENIMHKDKSYPIYKNASWIPEETDENKYFKIELENPSSIKDIKLYQNSMSKGKVTEITVELNNGTKKKYKLENKMCNTININLKNQIKWIKINVDSREKTDSGFSEIEIIPFLVNKIEFIKILIDDNFINDIYYVNNLNYKLDIYCYNGKNSLKQDYNQYTYFINGKKIDYNDLNKYKGKDYILKVCLKDNHDIYDEIMIKHITNFDKIKFFIKKMSNKIIFVYDESFLRVQNKIARIFGKI